MRYSRGVLAAQLIQIEQVAATAHRIFHRDDLSPLAIGAQLAAGEVGVAQVNLDPIGLGLAAIEVGTGPERIGGMGRLDGVEM